MLNLFDDLDNSSNEINKTHFMSIVSREFGPLDLVKNT